MYTSAGICLLSHTFLPWPEHSFHFLFLTCSFFPVTSFHNYSSVRYSLLFLKFPFYTHSFTMIYVHVLKSCILIVSLYIDIKMYHPHVRCTDVSRTMDAKTRRHKWNIAKSFVSTCRHCAMNINKNVNHRGVLLKFYIDTCVKSIKSINVYLHEILLSWIICYCIEFKNDVL